jgi:DNA ligase (NAD+)
VLYQIIIGGTEMSASVKAAIDGEGGRVRGLQDKVLAAVDELPFALGIRAPQHEDDVFAMPIERIYRGIRQLFPSFALMAAGLDELQEVEGIGEVMAKSIISYFHNEQNREIVERLRGYGLQFELSQEQTAAQSDKLAGQSVVISGVFQHHSRDEYKLMIEQNGGKNVGSISSKTSFILAGENMGPSKLEKAKKLGIRIVNEDEFLEILQ